MFKTSKTHSQVKKKKISNRDKVKMSVEKNRNVVATPVNLKSIRVISFDLDNTLWDNDPVVQKANSAESKHIEANFPEIFKLLSGKTNVMEKLRKDVTLNYPNKSHDLNFVRKKSLEYLGRAVNFDNAEIENFVLSTFKVFDDARQLVQDHFYPGTLEMLKMLKDQGFILVANTNGTARSDRIPEIAGLFDFHVSASTAGALKPNSAPFEQILKFTKVAKDEVLHVGDNIIDDVRGSVDFGMYVVWVDQRLKKIELKPSPHSVLGDSEVAQKYLVARIPTVSHVTEVLAHFSCISAEPDKHNL